jgi:indolepyruvate ferredoxin oxidoreductase beta subunit
MCYDDIVRVASHKVQAARFARIRREVRADERDVVRVFDFFKPGIAEIADIMPRRLGRWLARRQHAGGKGITLQSSSVTGMLALRALTMLRPMRRRSLRFAREQRAIEAWLAAVATALNAGDAALALEVARLPRLRKGYGDTHAAGEISFRRALRAARDRDATGEAAARVRQIVSAAVGTRPDAGTDAAPRVSKIHVERKRAVGQAGERIVHPQ